MFILIGVIIATSNILVSTVVSRNSEIILSDLLIFSSREQHASIIYLKFSSLELLGKTAD